MTEVFTELITKLKDNLEKLKEKVFIILDHPSHKLSRILNHQEKKL